MASFIGLLKKWGITALCDVRTYPRSGYAPQFNQENLAANLKESNIHYIYLGKELGGKEDIHIFDQIKGVNRIQNGLDKGHVIAIMCAEKDWKKCHRAKIVGKLLISDGVDVFHILDDGTLEKDTDTKNSY
jgi:uncharacterized protein (DUF488 family)